jgi:hypothetical protein
MVVLKPESVRCTVWKPDNVRFSSTMTTRRHDEESPQRIPREAFN